MFKNFSRVSLSLMLIVLLTLSAGLVGCGGSSGDGSSLAGGGGKAALNNSSIAISSSTGAPLGTGTITNGVVSLTFTTSPSASDYPVLLTATGGELVQASGGNVAFSGTLRSYILESSTVTNITAFTTLHSYLYDNTDPQLSADARYQIATDWMNAIFSKFGVDVGTVNFLTDDPYSGSAAVAYEMAQQYMAFLCNASDAAGLANIAPALKEYADTYADAIEAGNSTATAVFTVAQANTPGLDLSNGGANTLANMSTVLRTGTVTSIVANATTNALNAADVPGNGETLVATTLETTIDEPADFTNQAVDMTVTNGIEFAGAASAVHVVGAITVLNSTAANENGDITVSWSSSYPALTVTNTTDSAPVTNGGTMDSGDAISITAPPTAGTYSFTFTSATETTLHRTVKVTVLENDFAVTDVQMQNAVTAGGSWAEDNVDGLSFTPAGAENGNPTLIPHAAASTLAANKFRAVISVAKAGSPTDTTVLVNFLAPEGIRFIRDSGNYANYAIEHVIPAATGGGAIVEVDLSDAIVMKANGNVKAGALDFGVRIEDPSDNSILKQDFLDNGMYVINEQFKTEMAAFSAFAWSGTTTGSADYDLADVGANFTATVQTWESLAKLGTTAATSTSQYYGAPVLKLIPGTTIASTGLTSDGGTTYANSLATPADWLTALQDTPGLSRTLGQMGSPTVLTVPSSVGSSNTARIYLVIPGDTDEGTSDIASEAGVLFTR